MTGTLKLTDRLRGIYVLPVNDGAGLLDGKDTFTRNFETPPIQHEAAGVIEALSEVARKVTQLTSICADWNLEEVEINGEMIDVREIGTEAEAALAKVGA